jgi:hypothetical protein
MSAETPKNRITKPSKNFSKPKRKRTIKRKPGSTNSYFDHNTELAIINFKKEEDLDKKNDLYVKEILPAFDALTENLINVYSYKIMHESKKDLKSECMEFLFRTVTKFDESKGSKAFSYFNVVAKNWLTIKSKQNAKRVKTYISADEKDNFTSADIDLFESHNTVPSYEDLVNSVEQQQKLGKVLAVMKEKVKTENEVLCLEAVEDIIDNIDNLEIFSKKSILMYLRESSRLSPKQLSIVLSSLKKKYKEVKRSIDDE